MDLLQPVAVLAEQTGEEQAVFVGGALAHGGQPPRIDELGAVVEAHHGLGVAHVDGNQHHDPFRIEGRSSLVPRSAVPSGSRTTLSIKRTAPTRAAIARNAVRSRASMRCAVWASARVAYSTTAPAVVAALRTMSSRTAPERSPFVTASAAANSPGEAECGLAILDEHVAARQGETVGFAHRGHLDDRHRETEVGHEATQHRQLLGVLASEGDPVGTETGEQLGDRGGDSPEMTGAVLPLHALGHRRHRHPGERRLGVHLLERGGEHDVDSAALGESDVAIERPRVAGEVVGIVELEGLTKMLIITRSASPRTVSAQTR